MTDETNKTRTTFSRNINQRKPQARTPVFTILHSIDLFSSSPLTSPFLSMTLLHLVCTSRHASLALSASPLPDCLFAQPFPPFISTQFVVLLLPQPYLASSLNRPLCFFDMSVRVIFIHHVHTHVRTQTDATPTQKRTFSIFVSVCGVLTSKLANSRDAKTNRYAHADLHVRHDRLTEAKTMQERQSRCEPEP